jgi:hypothetical protein
MHAIMQCIGSQFWFGAPLLQQTDAQQTVTPKPQAASRKPQNH